MYHNLETKPFLDTDFNQDIDQNKIMESLKFIHKNYAFSTFPYLVHCNNSKDAINNFKSGNCISLSIGLKNYLKEQYNVESFLIPATIPNMYNRDGYLDISHVALAIPRNKKKIYIADCAFYFINPIKVRDYKDDPQVIFTKNIYEKEYKKNLREYKSLKKVYAKTGKLEEDLIFNDYQKIPMDTFYSECYEYKNDKWKYFLTEILNPDKAISCFFINIRIEPFIVSTKLDENGICTADYIIKIVDNKLSVKKEHGETKLYNLENIEKELDPIVEKEMEPYFKEGIKKDIIKFLSMKQEYYDIND